MTRTVSDDLTALRHALAGPVIGPDDPRYDGARTVWNADIDRRPLAVARCTSAADVSAALTAARAAGWEVTVRGGAHSAAGNCIADDALMIDLSGLDAVLVDPEAAVVRVGGGATLAQVDAATAVHGLATVGGTVSHTGVGGLTLGGGMGWLTPRFGLAIDNLLGVEIVTADGAVLRADAEHHPDLFWAVRGGGGNFGVVTEFVFRAHPLDPVVAFAMLFWPAAQGAEVLRLARTVHRDLPDDTNLLVAAINAPPAPFVPEHLHGASGYAVLLAGFDGAPGHAGLVQRLREALPPAFELVTPLPYVALQQLIDEHTAFGSASYEKGSYVPDLDDDVVAVLAEHVARKRSPLSTVMLMPLDRAYCAVPDADTAFGGTRTPRWMCFLIGMAPTPDTLGPERDWTRALWSALQPFERGGAYVNGGVAPDEHDRVREVYGAKYARLAAVKAQYDPRNVFHRNVNIAPGG
jgi:FAD/FMN-containing dehydrogenase